jgi:hypothetical protein
MQNCGEKFKASTELPSLDPSTVLFIDPSLQQKSIKSTKRSLMPASNLAANGLRVQPVVLPVSNPVVETKQKIRIFILAGQSNMVGYSPLQTVPASYLNLPEKLDYYVGAQQKKVLGRDGNYIGPEVGLAAKLVALYPKDKIVFIKSAQAGTSLRHWVIGAENNKGEFRSCS